MESQELEAKKHVGKSADAAGTSARATRDYTSGGSCAGAGGAAAWG
jgi:hypothetical protein